MRVFFGFLVLLFILPVGVSYAGEPADSPKKGLFDYLDDAGKYIFGNSADDGRQPYLHEGKVPQNVQWDLDGWKPEDWADDKKGIMGVIDGFYDANILVRQYEDKVPVLEVGKPFMRLSGIDQHRVVSFIDYAFGITEASDTGVFYIVIDQKEGKRLLGLYSIHGLQMQ